MAKSKTKPSSAAEAVRNALEGAELSKLKPIEVVKVALSAYQAFNAPSLEVKEVESQDVIGLRRGTHASIDRLLFNVNYWLSAYEDRIVECGIDAEMTHSLLKSIATWNSHTMKLNTLSPNETIATFERFCPPLSINNRRGGGSRTGQGKGPVHDFLQHAQKCIPALDANSAEALKAILQDVIEESRAYESYNDVSALDALYDLLPAWCLQDRIQLVRGTWWNDADIMMAIAEAVCARFRELGFALPLCSYYLDAMRESVDNYMRTITTEPSPYGASSVPELINLVRDARSTHPDSEVEGYGDELPAWLDAKEQLIWNTVVCAIYGPMHARPLLADSLSLLPVEGQPQSADVITEIAKRSFQNYLVSRRASGSNPEFVAFEAQPDDLRNSGLERIEYIPHLLDILGYRIVPFASCYPEQRIHELKPSEVECLAILEHRRWLTERRNAGWKFGETKDVAAKESPYLVDWEDLPEHAREWNRALARDVPDLLAASGLAVSK